MKDSGQNFIMVTKQDVRRAFMLLQAFVPVDIQLVLLIVVQETPPRFVDREPLWVSMVQQVVVLLLGEGALDLDNLAMALRPPHRAGIYPPALATPLTKPGLDTLPTGLKSPEKNTHPI